MRGRILKLALLLCLVLPACDTPENPTTSQAPVKVQAKDDTSLRVPAAMRLPRFDKLYTQCAPSVVNVRAYQPRSPLRTATRASSLGSGFVLDEQGHVLTCDSVIEDAQRIDLELLGGRVLEARVAGMDRVADLALLQVDPTQAPKPLPTGAEPPLQAGDWVVAFGYPYGLSHSITAGMVSALRSAESMHAPFGRILTDAAINPGCNGGPLLNRAGRVVGINLVPPDAGGLGLALPWRDVSGRVQALLEGRQASGCWLGLSIQPVSVSHSRELGLSSTEGVFISAVLAGSPAAQAGLRKGDVILDLAGQCVEDPQALRERLETWPAGRALKVGLWREGKKLEMKTLPARARP